MWTIVSGSGRMGGGPGAGGVSWRRFGSDSGPGRGLARGTALYLCAAVNICILSCPFSFPPFPLPPPSFLGQGPSQPEIRIAARPSCRPPARAMIRCMPGAGAATPPNRPPRETWPPPPFLQPPLPARAASFALLRSCLSASRASHLNPAVNRHASPPPPHADDAQLLQEAWQDYSQGTAGMKAAMTRASHICPGKPRTRA